MRERLELALRSAARRAGVTLARHPLPESLEGHLRTLLAAAKVGLVLDVGAHRGGFVERLRGDVGWSGPVTSFEPSPTSRAALEVAAGDDAAWTVLPYALGRQPGSARLHTYAKGDLDSLLPPSAYGRDRYRKFAQPVAEVEVEVVRLDQVLDEATRAVAADASMLLKTDTQGTDLDVVEGAGDMLERIPVLLLELAVRPLYEGAPTLVEALPRLAALGYEPTGLFPVSRAADLGLVTLDCTLRRTIG